MPGHVGFIGTGAIGAPIALRLLKSDCGMVAYDQAPEALAPIAEAGGQIALSAAAAADGAGAIFTCLPSAEALEAAYFGPGGVVRAAQRPPLAIDLSTSGPGLARQLGARLQAYGMTFVDAPISGGPAVAAAGQLTVIVSGSEAAVQAAWPLLQTFGRDLFRVGLEPGQAQVVKLINNVLSYAALAVTSEALIVGRKAGVDLDAALLALNAGTGRNSATESKVPDQVLSRRFAYGAANRISHKDLSLFRELADQLQARTPIANLLHELLQRWMPSRENEDMTSIARLFEGWAGVELRGAAAENPRKVS